MHLFLKTLYMLTVMVTTAMMMVVVLLSTPDIHARLTTNGMYQRTDLAYNQLVIQSLDNPGVFVADETSDVQEEDEEEEEEAEEKKKGAGEEVKQSGGGEDEHQRQRGPVKREAAWDYSGNNTGHLKILLDYGRPQHEPWPGRVGCAGLRVAFARRLTLPRTALASFPGSGNTWLRYLIQGATGLFTGSVYLDRELATKGFYGENEPPECGCAVVVKTHGYCLAGLPATKEERLRDLERFYGRGLLLLRSPYDTLIAYRNYLTAGHLGVAGPDAFRGTDWERFVRGQTEMWKTYAIDWLTQGRSVLLIHYERLLQDPQKELLRILHFLRLRVDQRRLKCTLQNLDGAFRRPTPDNISYRLRDPFTPALHVVVEAAMREVDEALTKLDREPLPANFYSYHHHHHHHAHHHTHHHHHHHNTTTRSPTHGDTKQIKKQKSSGSGVSDPPKSSVAGVVNGAERNSVSGGEGKGAPEPPVLQLSPWVKGQ
ncbi:uncharacterized protein LOC126987014 [Eriocheir sinensis]|uniref:uncharacterized protein LOC126987014 n=1 Tax=Eriocheir sinensis TaxID=95602 RepID=UPI0021C7AA9E|nr:uncharacterized protein LOC126987014 [Eriocheir sinensis]XP_050699606.1 uncharacterized protein LOC126987014 [Eriocheir sinensis]